MFYRRHCVLMRFSYLKTKLNVFVAIILAFFLMSKNLYAANIYQSSYYAYVPVRQLTEISVATTPNKTSYAVGDYLDMNGLVLRLIYSDGTSEYVSYHSYNASNFIFFPPLNVNLTKDNQYVIVNYSGVSTFFVISVTEKELFYNNVNETTTRTGRIIDKNSEGELNAGTDALLAYLLSTYLNSINQQGFIDNSILNQQSPKHTATIIIPTEPIEPAYILNGGSSGIMDASGNVYNPDGTISLPNNAYVDTNGITHYSDGSVKTSDGTIYNTDGSIEFPNGTLLTSSGRIIKRSKKAMEVVEEERSKGAWKYNPVTNQWELVTKE